MPGILDNIKPLAEKKKAKDKSVYHVVWDRKDKKTGEINRLSSLLAEAMTRGYGQKFDPMNLDTGVIKAFVEDLLSQALGKSEKKK